MAEQANGLLLKLRDVYLNFGGVVALDGVSFEVRQEEIFAIIGPNGAGKTCILNCINGFYHFQKGDIYFGERNISNLPPDKIAQLGISRSFQNMQLYSGLSTVDNLMAARHFMFKSNVLEAALYFGRPHREEIQHRQAVEEIIDFLELERWRNHVVGVLPYGVRKRVDLGRALAQNPRALLLDEPMAGMNLEEKEDMARFILDAQEERKVTIVLIEHDMGVVMDISDRIAVLDFGKKIAEGTPEEVKCDQRVITAYLGQEI